MLKILFSLEPIYPQTREPSIAIRAAVILEKTPGAAPPGKGRKFG